MHVCVCSYHERMSLIPMDLTVMSTTHLPSALRQCVYDVNNATSHAAVSRALCRLRWYLVVTAPVFVFLQHLNSVPWKPAIARYVLGVFLLFLKLQLQIYADRIAFRSSGQYFIYLVVLFCFLGGAQMTLFLL